MIDEKGRQCCLCARTVVSTRHEPAEVAVFFKDGSSQHLWVHIDCFGIRLDKSVPFLSLKEREELER